MEENLVDYLKLMILYRIDSRDIWFKREIFGLEEHHLYQGYLGKREWKERMLLQLDGRFIKEELEFLKNNIDFLKKNDLDLKSYSIEYYNQKIVNSESFLNDIEHEIQNYQPVTFESTLTKNDLEFLKLGKKYNSYELDYIYGKTISWILLPIWIYNVAKMSLANSHNLFAFIVGLFLFGFFTFFLVIPSYYLVNIIADKIYKSINKKKIERFDNLHSKQYKFKNNNRIATLVINESILILEEYRNRIKSFKASIIDYEIDYEIKQKNIERCRKESEEERLRRQLLLEEQERQREIYRKKAEYWFNLSGYSFEDEVSVLFSKKGFKIQRTPYSGDGGIDLIVHDENGKMGIVQCKNFNKQASPSIARDLYGTKHATKADFCILVCSGGFTLGTIKFAKENDIQLIDIQDLINMSS